MATIHVWHLGSNTSPYDTWAKAATTLNTGLGAWATGDVVYVAKDHTEGTSTITISGAGSFAEPVPIYTADRTTSAYATATTNTLDCIGGNADINTTSNSGLAFHGLRFVSNDNQSYDMDGFYYFQDCVFETQTTNAILEFGSADSESYGHLKDCTFQENGGSRYMNVNGNVVYEGCTFTGTVASGGLLRSSSARMSQQTFLGCDFSGLDTGEILVDSSASGDATFIVRFINCDFPATVTITDGGFGNDWAMTEVISSDSGGNLYRYEKHTYRGTITTQTGNLYRTNGYQDADGTTNASHKMVPASVLERCCRLEGCMLMQYVSTTGSKTIEIHAADTFTTAPNQNQLYAEIFYLNAAGETLYTLGDTRPADLLATTALTTTTGEWTDTGSALTHEYKVSATVTVNQAGYVGARIVLEGDQTGETANALYYDPKLNIT